MRTCVFKCTGTRANYIIYGGQIDKTSCSTGPSSSTPVGSPCFRVPDRVRLQCSVLYVRTEAGTVIYDKKLREK